LQEGAEGGIEIEVIEDSQPSAGCVKKHATRRVGATRDVSAGVSLWLPIGL
jgi:hypothetical protein